MEDRRRIVGGSLGESLEDRWRTVDCLLDDWWRTTEIVEKLWESLED